MRTRRTARFASAALALALLCACGDSEAPDAALDPSDNTPPIARLSVPSRVAVGQVIVLDGSESSDPDGEITTYLFSFNGPPFLQSRDATLAHTFMTPGEVLVSLTVIDDLGTKATERATVFVSP